MTPRPARTAPHVRVRGTAHIEAHAAPADGGKLRFEGTLADDANVPLEEETISVSLSADEPHPAFDLERCPRLTGHDGRGDSSDPVTFTRTDDGGRFCVVTTLPVRQKCVAHFAWRGTHLLEGTKEDVHVDPWVASIELRFDPEPTRLFLDREPLGLDAVAPFTDRSAPSSPPNLALTLTNELGAELGHGTTNASGRVHFDLLRPGPPGEGELRVAFAGNASTASASHVAHVERHARVSLHAPGAEGGTLPPGTSDQGISVVVVARTSSGDPVRSGSVEAEVGGNPVGAATVENGTAKLVLTFSAEEGTVSEVRIRYDANAPWYEPGDDVVLRLPIVSGGHWRAVPLVAAGLGVVAWLLLGRTARTVSARPLPSPPKHASTAIHATITVRAPGNAAAGWAGQVVDAHDATAVGGAEITISRPGSRGDDPLARATANEAGRFEIRNVDPRTGDQLTVSSRLHATLRQDVPAFGEIEIALVLRRRALLDRFVAWARKRGAPFDAAPEPTPAQVALATARDPRAARWARKIERAVFGPEEVDAHVESELEGEAPPPSPESSEGLEQDLDDTPR